MIDKNLIIHFENAAAMVIYLWEMEGQISDGKYENSRPYDHWKWINYVDNMVIDGKNGIENSSIFRFSHYDGSFYKKYTLNEWFSEYIKKWRKEKDTRYKFGTRIIAFGKFGHIYPEITYDIVSKFNYAEILLESIQSMIEDGTKDPEVIFKEITDFKANPWREKYYESCKEYITLDFLKKFIALEYDVKECKKDVLSMQKSINNKFKD